MLKRLIAALRLSETATEDEVVAALEKLTASHTEQEAKLTASAKAKNAETEILRASVDVLKASNEAFEKKFAAMEVERHEAAVKSLITDARNAGVAMPEKLVASITTLAKHSLDDAKQLVASLPRDPALKPEMGTGAAAGTETAESARVKLTAAAQAIAKETGVSLSQARDAAFLQFPELSRVAATANTTKEVHQ